MPNPTEQVDAVIEARELAIYVEGVAAGVQDIRLGKAAMALKTLADEVDEWRTGKRRLRGYQWTGNEP